MNASLFCKDNGSAFVPTYLFVIDHNIYETAYTDYYDDIYHIAINRTAINLTHEIKQADCKQEELTDQDLVELYLDSHYDPDNYLTSEVTIDPKTGNFFDYNEHDRLDIGVIIDNLSAFNFLEVPEEPDVEDNIRQLDFNTTLDYLPKELTDLFEDQLPTVSGMVEFNDPDDAQFIDANLDRSLLTVGEFTTDLPSQENSSVYRGLFKIGPNSSVKLTQTLC